MSQSEVAEQLGVAYQTCTDRISRTVQSHAQTILKLAKVFEHRLVHLK